MVMELAKGSSVGLAGLTIVVSFVKSCKEKIWLDAGSNNGTTP
jgi:hypothetical protein